MLTSSSSSISTGVLYYGLGLVFCVVTVLLRWNDIRYRRKGVPPGTMGWPIFGETSRFLKQGPAFMKDKRARYGNLFRTHVLGSPTVISMDPELNKNILMNETQGLVPGYPESMRNILGNTNIASVHGAFHKRIRGSLLSLVSPHAIKDHLLIRTDQFMRSFIHNWAGQTIDIQDKAKQMAFFVSTNQIVDDEPKSFHEAFKATFDNIYLGTICLPINIPGTSYYKGLKARKKVNVILKELLAKRRASDSPHDDILEQLLRWEDPKYKLNDEEIIDQIITILYSGYETVSTTTMMAVKYLHDNPKVIQELREEHFAILERKGSLDEPLTWEDYKNMSLTRAVILETSRLASVVNGVLRKTYTDVEMNGFKIPKGWRIYVYTSEINYDPFLYPEPFSFNPRRWLERNLEAHPHNMLFGSGLRICPGKELGIAHISIFLHHFVTKFRWEAEEGNELRQFPRVEAPNGLNIRVTEY